MSSTIPAMQVCSQFVPRKARQRGSALVEQALILPVLLAVLFGVIDMSRALYTYTYVSYIAREATRWASVRSANSFNGSSAGNVQGYVSNVTGMGLDSTAISSTTNYISPANQTPLCPGGLSDNPLNNKPGCMVQVTVNYNFAFIFPFLPRGKPFVMSSTSQMIITQ